jgi:hypothetical protein
MSNFIRFGFTALNGTNKAGIITPDANGYYKVVLGGLNVYNSANQYYPYEPAKELFLSSAQLMRRVASGALRGEYGHPKLQPGQSMDSFAQRILSIYEECVSHHIASVELDFDNYKDKDGRPIIAIIGLVKPMGPNGPALQASFENPNENVSFSIRAFTRDDTYGRVTNRILRNIVTWDYVNEPGIAIANKFQSPALEEISDLTFTKRHFERALELPAHGIAQESIRLNTAELFQSLGWDQVGNTRTPLVSTW